MRKEYIFADKVKAEDIKDCRAKLGLTQAQFAQFANVSKKTIERWESGKVEIDGPIVTLLQLLKQYPDAEKAMRTPPKKYPLRLVYKFNEEVCSIIDVDERKRLVVVTNFNVDYMYRAFGRNDNPTFGEYEAFIESRCFPRERDKMKIQLELLDLPFYDPLLIIEKTEGRMAEDDFRLIVEK